MASYVTRRQIWINIEKCLEWLVESGKWEHLLKLAESSLRMNLWSSRHDIPRHDHTKDDLNIAEHLVTSRCDHKLNAKQKEFLTDACLHYVYTYYAEGNEPDLSDVEISDKSQIAINIDSEASNASYTESLHFNSETKDDSDLSRKENVKVLNDSVIISDEEIGVPLKIQGSSPLEACLTPKSSKFNQPAKTSSMSMSALKNSSPQSREMDRVLQRKLFERDDDLDDQSEDSSQDAQFEVPSQNPFPFEARISKKKIVTFDPESFESNFNRTDSDESQSREMHRALRRKLFERDDDLDDESEDPSHDAQSEDPTQNPLPFEVQTSQQKRFELHKRLKEPSQVIMHQKLNPDSDSGDSEVHFDVAGITKDINTGKVDHLLDELTKEQTNKFWRLRFKSAEAAAHFYLACLESDEEENSEDEEEEEMIEDEMAIEEEEADQEEIEMDIEMRKGCFLTSKKGYKECMVCGKAVARLKRHMVSVHEMSAEEATKEMKQQEELFVPKMNTEPLKDCPVRDCNSRVQRLDHHINRVKAFKNAEGGEYEDELNPADGTPDKLRDDATVRKSGRRAGFTSSDVQMLQNIFKEEIAEKHLIMRQLRAKLAQHPESKILTDRFVDKQLYDKLRCLMK